MIFCVCCRHPRYHPEQAMNFPHHFHDSLGRLTTSVLSGDPLADLPVVLAEVKHYLQGFNPVS